MVLKPNQNSDGHGPPRQDQDAKTSYAASEVREEGEKMSILQKLTLSASLFGNDACCNFEHLYTVPVLQTLGLPLRLATLTGAFSGPTCSLLLPLLGWLTDQGSNPQRRKTMAAVFVCGVAFTGVLCVLTANILHLSNLLDVNNSVQVGDPYHFSEVGTGRRAEASEMLGGSGLELAEDGVNSSLLGPAVSDVQDDSSGIPFKAGLALLGFVMAEIGVDGSHACMRSFALTSSPSSEHTSLLIIGLTMASAGGVSTAALGLVDIPYVLGLDSIEGARLTIQTTAQASVIIIIMILCLSTSLLSVRRLLRLRRSSSDDATTEILKTSNSQSPASDEDDIHHNGQLSRRAILNAFEDSIHSFGGGSIHFDRSLALLGELQRSHSSDHHSHQISTTEHTPLLGPEKSRTENKELLEKSQFSSLSVSFRKRGSLCSVSEHVEATTTAQEVISEKLLASESLEDRSEVTVKDSETQGCRCEKGFRMKVFLVILSTFFAACILFMFAMTGSDFVGKAIYGGDPAAMPGSQSLANYEQGVRMASLGFFTYYSSFLISSFIQSRVLACIGNRVEFVLVNVVVAVTLVATSLTEMLEVYFVLTVVAGAHRACLFSVPFAVINDLMQSRASERGEGKVNVGFAFCVLTASIPMAYCVMFSWIGTLEELTGVIAVPYWVATVCAVLSAIVFLAIGKV